MNSIIKIDGKDYDLETLSDVAKQQVANINVVDQEIVRLNMQMAIAQTARAAYAAALNEALPKEKATKKSKASS